MRAKSMVLILIALGCGLVATVGVGKVLQQQDSKPAEPTETVLVAVRDVAIGEQLTKDDFREDQFPQALAPVGAVQSFADIESMYAEQRMFEGEPLMLAKFTDVQPSTLVIPKGYQVTSIKVSMDVAVSNLVKPGDHVDIIAFLRRSADVPATGSRTILRDVTVFAVNSETKRQTEAEDAGGANVARTVSMLVKPKEAQILTMASELGKLKLALRRPDDEDLTTDDETTVDELFGGGSSAPPVAGFAGLFNNPQATLQPPTAPVTAAKPAGFQMQIITPQGVATYEWQEGEEALPEKVDGGNSPAAAPAAGEGSPGGVPASFSSWPQGQAPRHPQPRGAGPGTRPQDDNEYIHYESNADRDVTR